MKRVIAAVLAGLMGLQAWAAELVERHEGGKQAVVIRKNGAVLATVPLHGPFFAVSYRNSIYRTIAEERYTVLPDGRYRLVEIAADQLAVLEEYYAVPSPPQPAAAADRRKWVVVPDARYPAAFAGLSIAATDLGERTLRVPDEEPLELWRLVDDVDPFVVVQVEARP